MNNRQARRLLGAHINNTIESAIGAGWYGVVTGLLFGSTQSHHHGRKGKLKKLLLTERSLSAIRSKPMFRIIQSNTWYADMFGETCKILRATHEVIHYIRNGRTCIASMGRFQNEFEPLTKAQA